MSEFMGKLFSDPSLFPGGQKWQLACAACDTGNCTQVLTENLGCETSSAFGFVQVLFHLVVYGYVLFVASNLISDGSELLLFVKSIQGIVGSVVLPILGAVPDGAIVLFSGLGQNAQEEVAVGVGALAGSTVMLLTVPWALSILAGRVDIVENVPQYRPTKGSRKLSKPYSLFETGIEAKPIIKINAIILLVTALTYLIIQGPAFMSATHGLKDPTKEQTEEAAEMEKWYSLVGFIFALIFFVAYLVYQVKTANSEDNQEKLDSMQREMVKMGRANISLAFYEDLLELKAATDGADPERESLLHTENPRLRKFLQSFFQKYDSDGNGQIDVSELNSLLIDMGEKVTPGMVHRMKEEMDNNDDGYVDFDEFARFMPKYILNQFEQPLRRPTTPQTNIETFDDEDDDDSEEEDVPEDLQHEDPAKQMRNIKIRAFWQMGLGTLLVLLFADPMCDILSDIGRRINVSSFYISFIVAPLASNASELLASYNYALKKTKKTITISLSTLLGAGIMNNTFCLSIFLLLIFFKGLAWEFSAETISILIVELLVACVAMLRVEKTYLAFVVLSIFPLCIFLVYALENFAGLD